MWRIINISDVCLETPKYYGFVELIVQSSMVLCCDFQNIAFYSQYRCKILYHAFASCLERRKKLCNNRCLMYNPKHNRAKFPFFVFSSQRITK
jgi:hypothetical protein